MKTPFFQKTNLIKLFLSVFLGLVVQSAFAEEEKIELNPELDAGYELKTQNDPSEKEKSDELPEGVSKSLLARENTETGQMDIYAINKDIKMDTKEAVAALQKELKNLKPIYSVSKNKLEQKKNPKETIAQYEHELDQASDAATQASIYGCFNPGYYAQPLNVYYGAHWDWNLRWRAYNTGYIARNDSIFIPSINLGCLYPNNDPYYSGSYQWEAAYVNYGPFNYYEYQYRQQWRRW